MDPSTRVPTTEERSDSAPSLNSRAEVRDRFSAHGFNQLTVISARGVIGAISALLFYFILRTPLLQNGTILAEEMITAPPMVVGFAAGYADRMVPSAIARAISITDIDESNESKDRDW